MEKTVAVVDVATMAKIYYIIIFIVIVTIKGLNVPKHKKLYHLRKANTNLSISQYVTFFFTCDGC